MKQRMFSKCFSWWIVLLMAVALIGCGGRGGDTPFGGTFVDAPVSGLTYTTGSCGGLTDANGNFSFHTGEMVTFSLGTLVLGTCAAKGTVTPMDLFGGAAVTDSRVTNMLVLLQTLDADGNLNNGIQLNTATVTAFNTYIAANPGAIAFTKTTADFQTAMTGLVAALNTAGVFTSNEAGGRLVRSVADAQAHMTASISTRKTVATAYGSVNGFASGSAWIWKGIPYAKPPVGAMRWKAPLDPDPWAGVREATAGCSECTQHAVDQYWRALQGAPFKGSEDCLYLDIYRPQTTETGLPVYVYIHGGSNNFGSAKQYDGTALATRGNMIVVFIQYRLAALGFLTHASLRQSGTDEDKSGNYGTLDQLKALTWIRNNIAAFGGDPSKVVIGGQSAGAHDTMNLVISPKSVVNGSLLFRGAFIQSLAMDPYTQSAADSMTVTTIKGLMMREAPSSPYYAASAGAAQTIIDGMTNAQIETYLRSKTAEQVMTARRDGTTLYSSSTTTSVGSMPNHSIIRDGVVFPNDTWLNLINAGTYNKVPIVNGGTRYEWRDFAALYGALVKAGTAGLPATVNAVPSGSYSWLQLLSIVGAPSVTWPVSTIPTGKTRTDILLTLDDQNLYRDITDWRSQKWTVAYVDTVNQALKGQAGQKLWSYLFNWNGGSDPALADFAQVFGAAHSMDIPFFQGKTTDAWSYSFTSVNQVGRQALQNAMMDYLISFVKTLDPNPVGSSLPTWQEWSNTSGAAKKITFDANLTNYAIAMDTSVIDSTALNTAIANAKTVTYAIYNGVAGAAAYAFTLNGL